MVAVTAPRVLAPVLSRRLDPAAICAWVLPLAVVAYLGLNNGGYEVLERSEVGIVLAECLLIGAAVLALPVAGGTRAGRVAIAILVAFGAWTALSLLWTESAELTLTEGARVGMYAAGFALALSAAKSHPSPSAQSAIPAAIWTANRTETPRQAGRRGCRRHTG